MVRRGCVMMFAKILMKYIEHTRDIKKPTAVLRKFVPFLTYMFFPDPCVSGIAF